MVLGSQDRSHQQHADQLGSTETQGRAAVIAAIERGELSAIAIGGQYRIAAESVWRTGHRAEPPPRQRRLRQMRRVLGSALTVILLVAAGVVVWLRFFDHSPFHVTKVSIIQKTKTACGENVTGEITTNGSAGTVSYQWVFKPQTQAPQPLSQSVTAGQHDVLVTVSVQGQGHGAAAQNVTLDVLGPDPGTASADVTISC